MMAGFRTALGLALGITAAAAVLAACDNGPSAVHSKTAAQSAAPAYGGAGERSAYASRDRAAEPGVDHPPAGALTLTRANGDTLFYDPKANVFAVAIEDGAPRTMLKPDEGRAYWDKQKERASRQASGSDHRRRSSDDEA